MSRDHQGSSPSAPPLPARQISGYEFVQGYSPQNVAPPAGFYKPSAAPPAQRANIEMPVVTEEVIRGALGEFVGQNCCYGRDPVRDMKILGFEPACAFHYILETFSETRETKYAFEPYSGEFLNNCMNGAAPMPWEVNITSTPIADFVDRTVKVRVPHTESVVQCHSCQGAGAKRCHKCLGEGTLKCSEKHSEESECSACQDSGWMDCSKCDAAGRIRCDLCKGKSQLKTFIELTATFKNHTNEFMGGGAPGGMPKNVNRAEGRDVFKESGLKVFPIPSFPEQTVLNASRRLLQEHDKYYTTAKVHCQRHRIRAVPVTRIHSQYKGDQRTFYMYGMENHIDFEDYYSKCGACSIM